MTISWSDIDGASQWIEEYVKRAGKKKAIVGVSGGIDSAVVATLCRHRMDGEQIVLVNLPFIENGDEDDGTREVQDAEEVADYLQVELEMVSIYGPGILLFGEIFKRMETDPKARMAYGNIKARLRMTALYAIAERENGLVIGTTNKTEAILGYYTKYGDGGVDIEPLMEYYKYEVREMAKILRISQHIIDKPPSAGLWPGQTDEGELGFTYDEIDNYIEYRHKADTIEFDPKLVKRVSELELQNRHKNANLPRYRRIK
jgi:NAD+ synthase